MTYPTIQMSPEREASAERRLRFARFLKSGDFTQVENQRIAMFELGHFGSKPWSEVQRCFPGDMVWQDAVRSLQRFGSVTYAATLERLPLKVDADFGPVTARSINERFCAHPDISRAQAAGGLNRWSITDFTQLSRVTNSQLANWSATESAGRILQACKSWEAHVGITVRAWDGAEQGPHSYVDAKRIDGAGRVVMYQYLPRPMEPPTTNLQMVIDTSENYLQNSWFFFNGVAHEFGHFLGGDHIPNQGSNLALMNPYLQRLPTLGPQPLDVADQLRRYPKPDKPEPPVPPTGELEERVEKLEDVTQQHRFLWRDIARIVTGWKS